MSLVLKKIQHVRVRNLFVTRINVETVWRYFANTSKTGPNKLVLQVQGPTDLARFRVRRARPSDESKVHSFILENSHLAWPGPIIDSSAKNKRILLEDFVSRTLCQGHSLVAEQQEGHGRWSLIRGVALNTCLSPWDSVILEKWAKCVKCAHFKKLIMLSAHCLRAPGLHEKYSVHNILQIILMVPPNYPKASQIAQVLAKTSIQRGRDMGYPVMRFDVTCDFVNKTLSNLKLVKEWEFRYKIFSKLEKIIENQEIIRKKILEERANEKSEIEKKIFVYTAFPKIENKSSTELKKHYKP